MPRTLKRPNQGEAPVSEWFATPSEVNHSVCVCRVHLAHDNVAPFEQVPEVAIFDFLGSKIVDRTSQLKHWPEVFVHKLAEKLAVFFQISRFVVHFVS